MMTGIIPDHTTPEETQHGIAHLFNLTVLQHPQAMTTLTETVIAIPLRMVLCSGITLTTNGM